MNKLIPNFLHRLDKYLLTHHQLLWETRFHYVVFFGGIYIAVCAGIALFMPLSLSSSLPEIGGFTIGTIMISLAGFVFWLFKQAQHNIMKDFGQQKLFDGRLPIYFGVIVLLALPVVLMPEVLNRRISALISLEELENDRGALNQAEPFFSSSENIDVRSYLECLESSKDQPDNDCAHSYEQLFSRFGACGEGLNYYNDHCGNPPLYVMITPAGVSQNEYYKTDRYKKEIVQAMEKYLAMMEKYGGAMPVTANQAWDTYYNRGHLDHVLEHNKTLVKEKLFRIAIGHAYGNRFDDMGIYVAATLLVFGLFWASVLLFTVKHTSLREIMGAGMAFIGLMIPVGLLEFANVRLSSELVVLFVSAPYIAVFLLADKIKQDRSYSIWQAIALILFNLSSVAAFFWTLLIIDELKIAKIVASENRKLAVPIILMGSILFYSIFIFPWAKKKFLLLAAMPKA